MTGDEEAMAARLETVDWTMIQTDLDDRGWAVLPGLLDSRECVEISSLWDEQDRFRSRVLMARHGFGRGEYRYLSYPLPGRVAALRTILYPPLAAIANRWGEALGVEHSYPDSHADFLERCHEAGQAKPTPLLLRYGPGDYNALHQDLYGAHVFPLQAAILLSVPGADFDGGEFLLTEQRPRMQSRGSVVPLGQGDAVVFAVAQRPVRGTRGWYRTNMRHGVSTVRSGERTTLGIIFHDAC